eukprot:scaffold47185_cov47-Prasinocladus_malaysianus.AAC.1
MEEVGVEVIHHAPYWADQFYEEARALNPKLSHRAIGTFLRLDIPILEQLQQYKYFVYSDIDTYVRKPVLLKDFGKLPKTISLGEYKKPNRGTNWNA